MPEYFTLRKSLKTKQKNIQQQQKIVVTSTLMFSFWLDPAKCPFSRIKYSPFCLHPRPSKVKYLILYYRKIQI